MALDSHTRRWLQAALGPRVRFDEPMARHTYFRVGGPADAFANPATAAELEALVKRAVESGIAYWIMGEGTNLLVGDAGIRGIVIRLSKGFDSVRCADMEGGGVRLTAMAGARLPVLCRYAADNGFKGLNFAVGIPGTVGGALMMNAGTADGCMETIVECISIMDSDGIVGKRFRGDIDFGYRRMTWTGRDESPPHRRPAIIEASFVLGREHPKRLQDEARELLERRRLRQPIHQPSAGCFFKNPPGGPSAGELIDRAGLKGKTTGGAEISAVHANFIVNRGNATAQDILTLAETARKTVAERFGVHLEFEVKIVGA